MTKKERILIVDDDPMTRMSITDVLLDDGYICDEAASGKEALTLLESNHYGLMLSDITMPGMDGITLLEQAKAQEPLMQAILITGLGDRQTAVRALRLGAHDFIVKPFSIDELLHSVGSALEQRRLALAVQAYERELEQKVIARTAQLEMAYDSTLIAMMAALDARDSNTEGHSQRVARLSRRVGEVIGLPEQELATLYRGALIHDVGKIGIPDAILLKSGKLTAEETAIMRKHPQIGYDILKDVPFLEDALPIVLAHHEHWNGNGYPNGLQGEKIPLLARIFTVVDVFDALTNDRPYRPARSMDEARNHIRACSGNEFDPAVVDAFLSITIEELQMLCNVRVVAGMTRG